MCTSPEQSFLRNERRIEKRQLERHYKEEKRELKTLKESLRCSVKERPCSRRADTVVLADRAFDPLQTAKAIDIAICALKEKYGDDLAAVRSKYRSARQILARSEMKDKSLLYDVLETRGCCGCCYKEMVVRKVLSAHQSSDARQPRYKVVSTTATIKSATLSDGPPCSVRTSLSSDRTSHSSTSTHSAARDTQESLHERLLSLDNRSQSQTTSQLLPPPLYADTAKHSLDRL